MAFSQARQRQELSDRRKSAALGLCGTMRSAKLIAARGDDHDLGLNPFLAASVGLGVVSVLGMGTGGGLLMFGVKALKEEPMPAKRTAQTIKRLGGTESSPEEPPAATTAQDAHSSAEIKSNVVRTQDRGFALISELADSLSLKKVRMQAMAEVREHPYRWSLVAAGCGLAGSYAFMRSRSRKQNGSRERTLRA